METKGPMKYFIPDGPNPPIEVELEAPPPCLFCDVPVETPSFESPLVCGHCAQSQHPNGARWTYAETQERWAHRRHKIDAYRALESTRTVHIPVTKHEKRLLRREGFLNGFVAARNPKTTQATLHALQEAEKAFRTSALFCLEQQTKEED